MHFRHILPIISRTYKIIMLTKTVSGLSLGVRSRTTYRLVKLSGVTQNVVTTGAIHIQGISIINEKGKGNENESDRIHQGFNR